MIVDVLGLGESLSLHDGNNITVGVNDIFKVKPVDVLVCVDFKTAFNPERLKWIEEANDCAFFSQLDEWKSKQNFNKIELQQFYPKQVANLDVPQLPKSVFSPYVAVALAYKLFTPSLIRVFGVDMTNHHNLTKQAERIQKDWKALVIALRLKGCEVEVYGAGLLTRQ
jgi:hypothetical protein